MNTAVTSHDTTSIAGARPTTGADVQTVPAPSYIPAMGMGSGAVMEGGTWGASSDQLGSARQWTELPTVGATVSSSPSSLYPVNMSWPLTVSEVPSTARVNVLATPFLPSCVPTIGTFSSVSSHAAQSGGHAIGFSGLGRCHTNEAMTNPQSVSMQTSYLLGQQLPPISKFSGEDLDSDGETFLEWEEQFELVAGMCGWNDQAKLVNLTTRLRGQAYAFYRTCTPKQRSQYQELKSKLAERFTPVRIQAVHSNLFHQRRQKVGETVDHYAQDLRRLFYKAYPRAGQGTEEAEDLGQSVLAYQFVAGLTPALRTKIAGVEGNFDQLLVKARFEDVKIRDLSPRVNLRNERTPTRHQPEPTSRTEAPVRPPAGGRQDRKQTGKRCYSCNGTGHFQKNCPLKARSHPVETPGTAVLPITSGFRTISGEKSGCPKENVCDRKECPKA